MKTKSIVGFFLLFFLQWNSSSAQFKILGDLMGMSDGIENSILNEKVENLRDILPEEYGASFQVYIGSYYIYSELMNGQNSAYFDQLIEKSNEDAAQNNATGYLLIAQEFTYEGTLKKLRVKHNLKELSEYSCASEEKLLELEKHLEIFLNTEEMSFYQINRAIIDRFFNYSGKLYNCCSQNRDPNYTCSAIETALSSFVEMMTNSSNGLNKYVLMENIENVGLVDIPNVGNSVVHNSDQPKGVEFYSSVGDASSGISSKLFHFSYNLENTAKDFASGAIITCDYYDLDNSTFEELPKIPKERSYATQLAADFIIVSSGDEVKVLFRLGEFDMNLSTLKGQNLSNRSSTLLVSHPLLYVLKWVCQAGGSIAMNLFMESIITTAITHFGEDTCDFSESLSQVLGEKNIWSYLIWSIEGILSPKIQGQVAVVLTGLLAAGLQYILNPPGGQFTVSGFFFTMAFGAAIGGIAILGGKYLIGKDKAVKEAVENSTGLSKAEVANSLNLSELVGEGKEVLEYMMKNYDHIKSYVALLLHPRNRRNVEDVKLIQQVRGIPGTPSKPAADFNDINKGVKEQGFAGYCIGKLGCFVKDTKVLVAYQNKRLASSSSSSSSSFKPVLATLPLLAIPIQDIQLFDYVLTHEQITSPSEYIDNGMSVSSNGTYYLDDNPKVELLKDPYTSDEQRERDEFDINDKNWNEVVFEEINGNSTAKFALHEEWIESKGYYTGAIVNLNLPEQGISGEFTITSIKHVLLPKKPVDEDFTDLYYYEVVTAIFSHVSDRVYTLNFDNGEQIGVTYLHPIYSVSAQDWKAAGELVVGDQVLTKSGNASLLSTQLKEGYEIVYNLEVKNSHNFLVGDSGIVVHNSCSKDLVTKYVDDISADLSKIVDKNIREALEELVNLKSNGKLAEFLADFGDDIPLHLGRGGVKAWEKLIDIPNIRVSVKSLETVSKWVDDGIELTFEAIQDGAKIINKNGDEVGELIKIGGDDVLAISDDFFVAAGTPKSFGTITVNSNTGEIFTNPGYIKNADGTIGFIEDVSSYGTQLIQNTIKQRGSLRGTLTGITKTQDAHHIIPVQLLKENDVVKKAVEAGFDFNKASNGMGIEKFVKATGQGRHGPHPQYTNQIRQYLNDWASQNPGFSAQAAMDELTDVVASVRNTINTTTTKLNDLPLGL